MSSHPEVCDICGGRASACRVLGHRPPGDNTQWQSMPPGRTLVERLRYGEACEGNQCRFKDAESGCICAEAATAIELAQKDAARLDWLDKNHFTVYRQRDPESTRLHNHVVLVNEDKQPRTGIVEDTIRAAIDAALDK